MSIVLFFREWNNIVLKSTRYHGPLARGHGIVFLSEDGPLLSEVLLHGYRKLCFSVLVLYLRQHGVVVRVMSFIWTYFITFGCVFVLKQRYINININIGATFGLSYPVLFSTLVVSHIHNHVHTFLLIRKKTSLTCHWLWVNVTHNHSYSSNNMPLC